jgi:hypothetical protein
MATKKHHKAEGTKVLDAFVRDLRIALETQAMGRAGKNLNGARVLRKGIMSFDYDEFALQWLLNLPRVLDLNMVNGLPLDVVARQQGHNGTMAQRYKAGSLKKKHALDQL